jgi:hypothetical protein
MFNEKVALSDWSAWIIDVRSFMRRSLFVVLCLPGMTANAGWYIGAGVGTSENLDYDCDGCGAIASVDDSGPAGKLFGGYRFRPVVAVELGFAQLADTESSGPLPFTDRLEVSGPYAAVVGILPIGDHFELFAKTGLMRWSQDVTYNGYSGSFSGSDLTYSIGGAFNLTVGGLAGWALQLEHQQFNDVGSTDPLLGHVDDYGLTTLNIQYRFL